MIKYNYYSQLFVSAFSALITGGAALAASLDSTSLEEIVITATKTGSISLQRAPISVSAITGEQISKTKIDDIRGLSSVIPNMSLGENSGHAILTIRGVGTNNTYTGSDPSNGVYIDGVYIARTYSQIFNFYDVERIEVLRGPQGTLYGRNSAGGAINVISQKPSDEFRAKAQVGIGNYGLKEAQAAVSGPIIAEKLQASISGQVRDRNGFLENTIESGRDRIQADESHSLRGQVRYASDKLEAITRADYSKQDGAPASFSIPLQPYNAAINSILGDYSKTAHNSEDMQRVLVWGISEDIEIEIGANTVFKSITAYRENESDFQFDSDSTDLAIAITNLSSRQSQFSQEFNLTGNHDKYEYVLGLYYFLEKDQANNRINRPAANRTILYLPHVKSESFAGYGQGSYHFTETFSVTLGGRYTSEKKTIHQDAGLFVGVYVPISDLVPLPGSPSIYEKSDTYSAFTPKVGIEITPDENTLLYASATRGFKSGGYNMGSLDPNQGFDAEALWSYEVGLKRKWLSNRLTSNVATFYYDYKNLQVSTALGGGLIDIRNAATARVKGIELEMEARPIPELLIKATGSYLDAYYKNYPNALNTTNALFDASGNTLNFAPKYTMLLAAQYDLIFDDTSNLSFRAELNWRSRAYFHPTNIELLSQSSYALINANISYALPDDNWEISIWARNIANKEFGAEVAKNL